MIKQTPNKESIFFTITIAFLVSFVVLVVSFIFLYQSNLKQSMHFSHKRDKDISKMILRQLRNNKTANLSKEFVQYLSDISFEIIQDHNKQQHILNCNRVKTKHIFHKRAIDVYALKLHGKHYILIKTPRHQILLQNHKAHKANSYILIIIFVTILLLFIVLYFVTINKLKPLQKLHSSVKSMGDEQFDVDLQSSKKDEISQLSNEFDKTAKKLKAIKESRNIFIRNIMHELKTPIAKGKILTHLPQTTENKEMLQRVFYRLESLIVEFSSIEELISTKKELSKKEYWLADIIDNSIDLLMCDESEVVCEFENIKLNVDFNLFSIAIKNLLDNGIKYSNSRNKSVTLSTDNGNIIFKNRGEKLTYPLERYYEPFFRGDDVKSNQSFGLGLYIVKHILNAHGYEMSYKHENGINYFIVRVIS
jgi:two-component system OmpR family sensor kinase